MIVIRSSESALPHNLHASDHRRRKFGSHGAHATTTFAIPQLNRKPTKSEMIGFPKLRSALRDKGGSFWFSKLTQPGPWRSSILLWFKTAQEECGSVLQGIPADSRAHHQCDADLDDEARAEADINWRRGRVTDRPESLVTPRHIAAPHLLEALQYRSLNRARSNSVTPTAC